MLGDIFFESLKVSMSGECLVPFVLPCLLEILLTKAEKVTSRQLTAMARVAVGAAKRALGRRGNS